MHNKLFIADAAFAVTGGRNIADEYFDRSPDANFIDMDVLSAGPVVAGLAAVFDRFWNSESAFPIASLARQPQRAAAFDGRVAAIAAPAGDAIGVAAELSGGRVDLVPARFDVLADAPLRAGPAQPDGPQATVAAAHLELVRSARASVQLASPYFIPGEAAMKVLAEVRARNVEVSVLTNSLATTDEPLVHFGYARYRGALLRAGVALHELIGAPRERGFGPVVGGGSAPGG
jgi:putative cardiolipin synthase